MRADRPLVAGIDAGGTHTTCALARTTGEVIALAEAGPGNVCTHPDTASGAIREAFTLALASAGADARSVAAASVGVAGFFACAVPGGPRRAAADLVPDAMPVEVAPDIEIALTGAARGADAVVVIAGTGSVAYGGTRDGRRARAGGWGYLLADEGSAFWIGLQAVRAALRAHDGRGPTTALTGRLLAEMALSDPHDLEGAVYGMESVNTGVAALAAQVLAVSLDGDPIARDIVDDAGRLLAEAAAAVLDRLDRMGAPMPVATVGGVLRDPDGPVRVSLGAHLGRVAPRAALAMPALPPVGGALLRAIGLAGLVGDGAVADLVAASLARMPRAT